MRVGIVGFSGCGKSTVFHWLTGEAPDVSKVQKGQFGTAIVRDERLEWLSEHLQPKKTTPATLEFVDTPGLLTSDRKDNPRRLAIIRECDGLLVVLSGSDGELAKELRNFRDELYFADLELVTNRSGKLQEQLKKPRSAKDREQHEKELNLLQQISGALEAGKSPRTLGLTEDQEKSVKNFQLLSLKPEMVLVNISEEQIGKPLPDALLSVAPEAIAAPARLELELQDLTEDERQMFMEEMNVSELSAEKIVREIFYGMKRIVFFSISDEECRAWAIHEGETAQQGAGEIHTDFYEGFVRAEIVPFEEFKKVGSFKEAKAHGVYRLEGKNYIVRDGDIMHILANR